jgi:hypothetical protein
MTKLITKYDATNELWFAYDNPVESESSRIGQGPSPEDACCDYWYQVHGSVAKLEHSDAADCWVLCQGSYKLEFASKEAAVKHANAREWQVNNWRRQA